MNCVRKKIHNWSRTQQVFSEVWQPTLSDRVILPQRKLTMRGKGNSYGDAALTPDHAVIESQYLTRFINFNETTGLLTVESGMSMADILAFGFARGWYLPVVPGTRWVTIGGAIASDIHGKNHWQNGSLAEHIQAFEILTPQLGQLTCSLSENTDLFHATLGGMGLTGFITQVTVQLQPAPSSTVSCQILACTDWQKTLSTLETAVCQHRFAVAWVDGFAKGSQFGRSLIRVADFVNTSMRSSKIKPQQSKYHPRILYPITGRLINQLYYTLQKYQSPQKISYWDHAFPLDSKPNWPAYFGRQGLLQYHCVIPDKYAENTLQKILQTLHNHVIPIYLAALKRFGKGRGWLSFPIQGFSLALDVPNTPASRKVLCCLDELVAEAGGRIYLAKDEHLSPELFPIMYPELNKWRIVKNQVDPKEQLTSKLAKRLNLLSS